MRIGFVSDIHEDIVNLKTAFAVLEKANCDLVVSLGDIVGFSYRFQQDVQRRNANACIDMVRDQCSLAVAGNHDLFAVRKIPEHTAGFHYRDDWYDLDSHTRIRLTRDKIWAYEDIFVQQNLTPRSIEYLRSLQEYEVMTFDGISYLYSHFAYPDLTGSRIDSIKKSQDFGRHSRFMDENNALFSFSGHGHPEGFARSVNGKLEFHPFGSCSLGHEQQWIVCPCVSEGRRANGVMIFDTTTFLLDVIALNP